MKHYDYIFAGAGLSSQMIVEKMANSGKFANASILLIDPDSKSDNDRTWCFWQKGNSDWDGIVDKKWGTALFADQKKMKRLDLGNYQYRMIKGLTFYDLMFLSLSFHPNVEFIHEKVISFDDLGTNVLVTTETGNYTCNTFFNSIYDPNLPLSQNKYPVLRQHFIGWHVKTEKPVFDPECPTFMDFSIPQKGNTRFMYLLPFSETEAIVEYTLFSKDLLSEQEYEDAINDYLHNLGAVEYIIVDKEKGSIPMTCYPFWENNTKNILNIGSAGGWTKASTGYTFRNADKLSGRLVDFLLSPKPDMRQFHKKSRFWFYDLLLLDILAKKNHKGAAIFSSMFKNGKAAPVFQFLDEETSLAGDLKVIWQCPKGLFLKALLERIFGG